MKFLSRHESNAYLLLRVVFGFLFACHGASKIFGVLGAQRMAPGFNEHYLSGVIELVGGVLIFLGLFTRPAAFIVSGEMAVAYFTVHAKAGFFPIMNRGELAVIYCFVALFIATRGAGKLGIDKS
jgi:putative oxidoreductase